MSVCLALACLGRSKRHFGKKRLCLRKEREILSVAPFCEPRRVLWHKLSLRSGDGGSASSCFQRSGATKS